MMAKTDEKQTKPNQREEADNLLEELNEELFLQKDAQIVMFGET